MLKEAGHFIVFITLLVVAFIGPVYWAVQEAVDNFFGMISFFSKVLGLA